VALVGTMRGVAVANILHYQLTTSGTPAQADLDAWVTSLANAWKTRLQSQLPSEYAFNYAKAVMYIPGGLELVSTVTPTAWSGTATALGGGGGNSKVISWQTNVYWRGGKPRTYIPLATGDYTAGTNLLTAALRTALATAANNFRTDCNALTSGAITGTSMGFVSFRTGNAERGTPLFFAVTGAIVHPRIGTQRRRDGKWQN
jgi:hypothetical protein